MLYLPSVVQKLVNFLHFVSVVLNHGILNLSLIALKVFVDRFQDFALIEHLQIELLRILESFVNVPLIKLMFVKPLYQFRLLHLQFGLQCHVIDFNLLLLLDLLG